VPLVFLDTETTGLNSGRDRIVEIAVVRSYNGRVVERRSWLIDPGMRIPHSAVKVHGITDEMVVGKGSFAEVFPEVERFLGNAVVLCHNARFDSAFLKHEIARAGLVNPGNLVIDTLPLSRKWFPESPRHSLEAMAEYLKIKAGSFHRAMGDADLLYLVFRKGMESESPQVTVGDLMNKAGGASRIDGTRVMSDHPNFIAPDSRMLK